MPGSRGCGTMLQSCHPERSEGPLYLKFQENAGVLPSLCSGPATPPQDDSLRSFSATSKARRYNESLMSTLIRNGTVVTAQETRKADVLIEGERISQVGVGPCRRLRCPGDRRHGHVRYPRRHRCPHPSRYALRRHHVERRFRDGHARRGVRRHHLHRRFRHPGARHPHARRARHLDEKGRRTRDHRLRPAHDCHRPRGRGPGRHGRHGARRRGQLQAVHGLPQRADGGRRHDFQGPFADRQERRADLHARRKRQRD